MSRSGYVDDYGDCEPYNAIGLYRANVKRSIKGRRGQKLLAAMLEALDAMEVPELHAHVLQAEDGRCCALGQAGRHLEVDLKGLVDDDPDYPGMEVEIVAQRLNVAECLVREVAFLNDDPWGLDDETPADRWKRMRAWCVRNLAAASVVEGGAS